MLSKCGLLGCRPIDSPMVLETKIILDEGARYMILKKLKISQEVKLSNSYSSRHCLSSRIVTFTNFDWSNFLPVEDLLLDTVVSVVGFYIIEN